MKQQYADMQTPESGGSGTSASGPQTESGNGSDTGPSSPGGGTSEPVYDDTEEERPKTLAENYQFYLSTLSTGKTGGSFGMNGSLQPEAPQAPGNVLTGRFANAMNGRGKWVLVAIVIVALVWWFNRKKG